MVQTFKEFSEQETNQKTPVVEKPTENQEQVIPAAEGQTAVKESVVLIDGKERPLKNYEAELRRKFEKEKEDDLVRLRSEYENRVPVVPQPAQPQQSWLDQAYQMAENEISTTGKAVPLQTIMQIANQIAQRNTEAVFTTREKASKSVNSFKRSVRSEPDWKEIEDDFDGLVEQLKPEQINAPTLEVVLNSVRGKRMKDVISKTKEQARKDAEKDIQVIGGSPISGISNASKPSSGLTPEQKGELNLQNKDTNMEWTEKEYLESLKKKQERFKVMGAKNIPQLLSDTPIK